MKRCNGREEIGRDSESRRGCITHSLTSLILVFIILQNFPQKFSTSTMLGTKVQRDLNPCLLGNICYEFLVYKEERRSN